MKALVLTALPWVDQSNCGNAISEAVTKKVSHSRHLLKFISARHPPTPITAIKLCACTSGSRPATNPAASMRFAEGKRKKEKGKREEPASVDLAISLSLDAAPSFFPRSSFFPFTFLLFPSPSLRDAAHH